MGILDSLDRPKAGAALDFVTERKRDIGRAALYGWLALLAMSFSLIYVVRLALHLPV